MGRRIFDLGKSDGTPIPTATTIEKETPIKHIEEKPKNRIEDASLLKEEKPTQIEPTPSAEAEDVEQQSIDIRLKGKEERRDAIQIYRTELLDKIIANDRKYNNSRKPMVVDEDLRSVIELIADAANIDMSQVTNNILHMFLSSDSELNLINEIRRMHNRQLGERLKKL